MVSPPCSSGVLAGILALWAPACGRQGFIQPPPASQADAPRCAGVQCGDELYCNGEEACDPTTGTCAAAAAPCDRPDLCDEAMDSCRACAGDGDCNDGLFCNGVETCSSFVCVPGTAPCTSAATCARCNEATATCAAPSGTSCGSLCGPQSCDGNGVCLPPGGSACTGVNPAARLQIDRLEETFPYLTRPLSAGDEVLNRFIVPMDCFGLAAGAMTMNTFGADPDGLYSVHVYADAAGSPGDELSASPVTLLTDASCAWPEECALALPAPLYLTLGEAFWIGLRSAEAQSSFLPLYDDIYLGSATGGRLRTGGDLTSVNPSLYPADPGLNRWALRADGCGVGPWLEATGIVQSPASPLAGTQVSVTIDVRNGGFASASAVSGVLGGSSAFTIGTSVTTFGDLAPGASATGTPLLTFTAAPGVFGTVDLPLTLEGGAAPTSPPLFAYVNAPGCTTENTRLVTHNGTGTSFYTFELGDEQGNMFEVTSASFTLMSVDVQFQVWSGSSSRTLRLKTYTIRQGSLRLVSAEEWVVTPALSGQPWLTFTLSTPLTFASGDVVWATIESQTRDNQLGVAIDNGTGASMGNALSYVANVPAWRRRWSASTGGIPLSALLELRGCAPQSRGE
jgi:hypothetical protein